MLIFGKTATIAKQYIEKGRTSMEESNIMFKDLGLRNHTVVDSESSALLVSHIKVTVDGVIVAGPQCYMTACVFIEKSFVE